MLQNKNENNWRYNKQYQLNLFILKKLGIEGFLYF